MKDQNIYGVILAGGSGSRLWPLSRQKYPKQLLKLAGEYSLFQSTFLRLADFIKDENIITVTNTDQTTDLQIQLDNLKSIFNQQNEYRVLSEPLGRNTAPAIALAVFYVLKHMVENNDDPILLVSPSDHLVKNQKEFTRVIQEGTKLADNGYIVTFGITPNKPETGYGYIKTEKTDAISNIALEGLKVSEFKEKPNFETAKQYLEAGTYYWNGGIFMFKASTMLNELQKYAKDIFDGLKDTKINAFGETISKDDYEQLPNISVDYAIMEKSELITLIPLDCGWDDLGSWEAIYETSKKDSDNNYKTGNTISFDTKDSLIYSTSKLVSTIGVKNLVVVETQDAVMICDKDSTQNVKKVFDKLKENNDNAYMVHTTSQNSWGSNTVLQDENEFKTISATIAAHKETELQKNDCDTHTIVLCGNAEIIAEDKRLTLTPGKSLDIEAGTEYKILNTQDTDLKVLLVQKNK